MDALKVDLRETENTMTLRNLVALAHQLVIGLSLLHSCGTQTRLLPVRWRRAYSLSRPRSLRYQAREPHARSGGCRARSRTLHRLRSVSTLQEPRHVCISSRQRNAAHMDIYIIVSMSSIHRRTVLTSRNLWQLHPVETTWKHCPIPSWP